MATFFLSAHLTPLANFFIQVTHLSVKNERLSADPYDRLGTCDQRENQSQLIQKSVIAKHSNEIVSRSKIQSCSSNSTS